MSHFLLEKYISCQNCAFYLISGCWKSRYSGQNICLKLQCSQIVKNNIPPSPNIGGKGGQSKKNENFPCHFRHQFRSITNLFSVIKKNPQFINIWNLNCISCITEKWPGQHILTPGTMMMTLCVLLSLYTLCPRWCG